MEKPLTMMSILLSFFQLTIGIQLEDSLLDDCAHQCKWPNISEGRLNWTCRLDDQ